MLMRCLLVLVVPLATLSLSGAPPPTKSADEEFFESKIRPILAEHCFQCHSQQSQKLKGGLRLDDRDLILKGGESGRPAAIPGQPEQSLLIEAVTSAKEDLQMPPKERLSSNQVHDLREWIRRGIPFPKRESLSKSEASANRADKMARHWAFQPVRHPDRPKVQDKTWVRNPVDAFVLARLEANKLKPNPVSPRAALLRRVTMDLTGLPPTAAEIDAFLRDASKEAYETAVDRLLNSPRYGEHWAGLWLDVARYADTKGYVRLQEQAGFPYAWTYRDYVVRSLNEDKPFTQFILEQLAADQLVTGEDNRALAGLGFLTLGRRFTANAHDIIDDRIDVVMRGLQGLTVTCARCHDHKYDPIPTADYYSLYGIFASSREPAELPVLHRGDNPPLPPAVAEQFAVKKRELEKYQQEQHAALLTLLRNDVSKYLDRALLGRQPFLVPLPAEKGEVRQTMVERWIGFLESAGRQHDPVFYPWEILTQLSKEDYAAQVARAVQQLAVSTNAINPLILEALQPGPLQSPAEVAAAYGKVFLRVHQRWQTLLASAGPPVTLPEAAEEQIRQVLYGTHSPLNLTPVEAMELYLYDADINQAMAERRNSFDAWVLANVGIPRAQGLTEGPYLYEPRIFLRGNPTRPGPPVNRGMVQIVSRDAGGFKSESGRLALARAIISPTNPLTARVLVNRVWAEYFGQGLVTTPSDFGLRADPPSHPELLDYLASRFMDEGWSLKKMQRIIVTCNTYKQSSEIQAAAMKKDPGNRWLWRMNRRRLSAEEMRDCMLLASGVLDLKMGGRPVAFTDPQNYRRSIYGLVDRQQIPTMLTTFGFPSRDAHSSQRHGTLVPQQMLFMMNHPFVMDAGSRVAQRAKGDRTLPEHVRAIYRSILLRLPTDAELRSALQYADSGGSLEELAQTLFMSNEFSYLD